MLVAATVWETSRSYSCSDPREDARTPAGANIVAPHWASQVSRNETTYAGCGAVPGRMFGEMPAMAGTCRCISGMQRR